MDTQYGMHSKLSAEYFRSKLRDAETGLHGHVPLLVFDNHDNRRSWNRFGDGQHDDAIARLIGTLLLAPRGTALMYYGQELGMSNSDPKTIDQVKDPIGKIGWPKEIGRDGERTPMQWDATPNAGFSSSPITWLPLAPGYTSINVAAETGNPASLLSYYRKLIHLRKQNPAFRDGDLRLVDEHNKDVLSFVRTGGGTTVLVAMNFSDAARTVNFDAAEIGVAGRALTPLMQVHGIRYQRRCRARQALCCRRSELTSARFTEEQRLQLGYSSRNYPLQTNEEEYLYASSQQRPPSWMDSDWGHLLRARDPACRFSGGFR